MEIKQNRWFSWRLFVSGFASRASQPAAAASLEPTQLKTIYFLGVLVAADDFSILIKRQNSTRVGYNEYALFFFYKNKRSLSRNTGLQEKMWKYLQFDRLVVNSQQESQQ